MFNITSLFVMFNICCWYTKIMIQHWLYNTVISSVLLLYWLVLYENMKCLLTKIWEEMVKMEMFYSCIQKVVQFIWLWKIPSQCRHIYFLSLILFNCMQYLETILLLRVAHINLKFSTLRFETTIWNYM